MILALVYPIEYNIKDKNMKKRFVLAMISMFLFTTCNKDGKNTEEEQLEDNKLGCITGKITIFNTGSVTDAYVRLSTSESGNALYSGQIKDGDYTINNVQEGTYFFRVYKQGFVDTLFNETIKILPKELNSGSCRRMDWAISKLPPHLYVVEVNSENVIHTLDFGSSDDRLYFQIYNNSETIYTWSTDFDDVKLTKKWLNTMNKTSGILRLNDPENITITIDRTKLGTGKNTTKFLIDSDKGGGWELTVTATGL
jgi:hypothetical protein